MEPYSAKEDGMYDCKNHADENPFKTINAAYFPKQEEAKSLSLSLSWMMPGGLNDRWMYPIWTS